MPFLTRTIDQNPGLIRAAVELHQGGVIPANTLVLDLDVFRLNASLLKDEADRVGLRLYFMSKQHGRNPVVYAAATEDGRATTVSVDIDDAKALHYNRIPLGHVGNLSQIPHTDLPRVVGEMRPEVMSVFSVDKARAASDAALAVGLRQDILIRVRQPGDVVFPGMAGGVDLSELPAAVHAIQTFEGVRIVGVSTFPALSYRNETAPESTPNMATLLRGAEVLQGLGVEVRQINAPGNTSVSTLEHFARAGATHVEPGSALSGHTTFNLSGLSPERPGAVYVTEISHFVDGTGWVYGGGFFVDDPPVPSLSDFASRREALVGRDPATILERRFRYLGIDAPPGGGFGSLDYHGLVAVPPSKAQVGDTVVFGFRIQAFVTRANVAVVEGTSGGSPVFRGLFDVRGHRLDPDKRW